MVGFPLVEDHMCFSQDETVRWRMDSNIATTIADTTFVKIKLILIAAPTFEALLQVFLLCYISWWRFTVNIYVPYPESQILPDSRLIHSSPVLSVWWKGHSSTHTNENNLGILHHATYLYLELWISIRLISWPFLSVYFRFIAVWQRDIQLIQSRLTILHSLI